MRKTIPGYPRYEIDETGRVFSLITDKELRPSVMNNGYLTVELFSAKGKSKRLGIHRLVALAFIPNPEGYPIVNHKDENRKNNNASNLEWCTHQYNVTYGTANDRRNAALQTFRASEKIKETARRNGQKTSKPVYQMTKDGHFVARFSSGKEAAITTGINHSHILETCGGKRKSAGGYVWAYEGRNDLSVLQF